MTLLALDDVHSAYGSARVLHGITLEVEAGERLALIGRNGVGKTTVVNTCIGAARLTDIETDTGPRLIERADAALYDSKRAGRNRVTAAWPVDESSLTALG